MWSWDRRERDRTACLRRRGLLYGVVPGTSRPFTGSDPGCWGAAVLEGRPRRDRAPSTSPQPAWGPPASPPPGWHRAAAPAAAPKPAAAPRRLLGLLLHRHLGLLPHRGSGLCPRLRGSRRDPRSARSESGVKPPALQRRRRSQAPLSGASGVRRLDAALAPSEAVEQRGVSAFQAARDHLQIRPAHRITAASPAAAAGPCRRWRRRGGAASGRSRRRTSRCPS